MERRFKGREVLASLLCIDSQSVKAGPFISQNRGIDGNKRVHHILVDILGLILGVIVTAANVADGNVGVCLMKKCSGMFERFAKILVDGVYQGAFVEFASTELKVAVEISSKPPTSKGFVPIKKRWVNERSFVAGSTSLGGWTKIAKKQQKVLNQ